MVCPLAGVRLVSMVVTGHLSELHILATVELRDDIRGLTIVDIGTILGLAHLIPETDQRWLLTSRIDLRTFTEIC